MIHIYSDWPPPNLLCALTGRSTTPSIILTLSCFITDCSDLIVCRHARRNRFVPHVFGRGGIHLLYRLLVCIRYDLHRPGLLVTVHDRCLQGAENRSRAAHHAYCKSLIALRPCNSPCKTLSVEVVRLLRSRRLVDSTGG